MKIPSYMRPKYPVLLVAGLGGLLTVVDLGSAQSLAVIGAPYGPWNSVASSADGTKLVAAAREFLDSCGIYSDGLIYTSPDSGATWTQTSAPTNSWQSVASSADGTKLVAAARCPFASFVIYGDGLS